MATTSIDPGLIRAPAASVKAGEEPRATDMMIPGNQYAAFLADFAADKLSSGERLAARLHFALSTEGAHSWRTLDATGGALLEGVAPAPGRVQQPTPEPSGRPSSTAAIVAEDDWVEFYSREDLISRQWRKSLFGVKTLPTHLTSASLLRLAPGERAPRHSHAGPDVTVVLRGAFADDWGEYARGDLAFAEPGDKHAPENVGDETCICLIATPVGSPTVNVRGLLARWWNTKGVRQ